MRFPLRWTAVRASCARAEQPTGCATFPAVEREDLLRATDEAFNARDIDAVLRQMDRGCRLAKRLGRAEFRPGANGQRTRRRARGSVVPVTRRISL